MRIVFSFSEKTYMYVQNNILVYTCLLKSSVVKLHRYDVCILLRICNLIHTRLKRKQQYKLHKCIKKWGRWHLHKVELNFLWYLIAGKVCSKKISLPKKLNYYYTSYFALECIIWCVSGSCCFFGIGYFVLNSPGRSKVNLYHDGIVKQQTPTKSICTLWYSFHYHKNYILVASNNKVFRS